MTKDQIEAVLERVRAWPIERQADAAQLLLAMEEANKTPYRLSPEERADIEGSLAEVGRGEVATEEEVAAVFQCLRK